MAGVVRVGPVFLSPSSGRGGRGILVGVAAAVLIGGFDGLVELLVGGMVLFGHFVNGHVGGVSSKSSLVQPPFKSFC